MREVCGMFMYNQSVWNSICGFDKKEVKSKFAFAFALPPLDGWPLDGWHMKI